MRAELTRLLLVWLALMALLATTIAATLLPVGPIRPLISYGIALAKTGLILWFFMEMRRENGLARAAGLAGFAWIAILFLYLVCDYLTRAWPGAIGP